MDATKFAKGTDAQSKHLTYLMRHTGAVREHQISIGLMFLYLNGYQVELHYMGEPLVWAAKELLEELETEDQISVWSQAPSKGGVWTTDQRRMLKTGESFE